MRPGWVLRRQWTGPRRILAKSASDPIGALHAATVGAAPAADRSATGWICPARDHNVSNRWVVLDGLLDSGDSDAMGAALAERQ
ncbi:hypothetical protein OHB12_16855 [Nocardia sp. NBC_01730]|uniref:hypothetical protein n=1 Tax=Nocardia sp. NBC_01730 TaxID=2975998 RepID=UPI002E0D4207|nr:hypothetical protein OHB12_16855 [Nocardia sp. NBC_01730]